MLQKNNPLKLNKLQLRTMQLFQEMARHPKISMQDPKTGEVQIIDMPRIHGNHVHIGDLVVSSSDASGFFNKSVWGVLERKGLARSNFPLSITLTKEGVGYNTGLT